MKNTYLFFLLLPAVLALATWNCSKPYALSPVSPASFTATPTITDTPCGYPGNTCTPTFTVPPTNTFTATNTFTPTLTPTITNTPTITSTPTNTGTPTNTASPTFTGTPTFTYTATPLPTVQGIFGIQNGSNDPSIIWVKDNNPSITSYKVYVSTTNAAPWALLVNAPKTAFTEPYCQVNDTTQAAPFTRYYYVETSNGGIAPDSPPSPEVYAISGTATTNGYTYSITTSPLTCTRVSGNVPGAANYIWVVEDTSQNQYWTWGEGGTSFNSVTFGYNTGGITYVPQQSLTPGTTYAFGTFTINSNNWVIDTSAEGFIDP